MWRSRIEPFFVGYIVAVMVLCRNVLALELSDGRDGRVANRRHNSDTDFPAVPSEVRPIGR
jgi:hypothetical protein